MMKLVPSTGSLINLPVDEIVRLAKSVLVTRHGRECLARQYDELARASDFTIALRAREVAAVLRAA